MAGLAARGRALVGPEARGRALVGLEARGRALAEAAVAKATRRARDTIGAVPGVRSEIVDDGIVATGKRLRARWLSDARLRWLGGWS